MSENKTMAAPVDLDSLDAVADASNAYKLEMRDPAGNSYPTPIHFLIIGRQADAVNKFYAKHVNDYIQKREFARRRGKEPEPKSAEEVQQDSINGAAVRVIGWEGIKQAFDVDTLKRALRRNPQWVDQIVEASDELGNYTRRA